MSATTVKVNGVEVVSNDSKPAVVNINLNQPSALASLLSAWKAPKTAQEGAKVPTKEGSKAPTFQGEQNVLGHFSAPWLLFLHARALSPSLRPDATLRGRRGVIFIRPLVSAPFNADFLQHAGAVPLRPHRPSQLLTQAIQIILGLVCVSFAVLFCFLRENHMFYTGSGFWTGVPFIVAGAISVVSGNRRSKRWLAIATLFNWAIVVVAIAGIVMILYDIMYYPFYRWSPDYLCNQQVYDFHHLGYYRGNTTNNYNMERCSDKIYRLLYVFNGLRIMFLGVTSLALCIALYSLGYGCKSLCCNVSTEQEEEPIAVTNDAEQWNTSQSLLYPEKPKMESV